jgi:hypothetical protein
MLEVQEVRFDRDQEIRDLVTKCPETQARYSGSRNAGSLFPTEHREGAREFPSPSCSIVLALLFYKRKRRKELV